MPESRVDSVECDVARSLRNVCFYKGFIRFPDPWQSFCFGSTLGNLRVPRGPKVSDAFIQPLFPSTVRGERRERGAGDTTGGTVMTDCICHRNP